MPPPAPRRRVERLLALVVVLVLGAGVGSAVRLQPAQRSEPVAATTRGRSVPADRTAAVQDLLARRAQAVLHHDRAAFLATVDPTAVRFRARQARVLDALRQVPLASWSYQLDATREQPADPGLDARRGVWWSPDVVLRYQLAGFDRAPTAQPQQLTFVQRSGRWYVAADDDFPAHPTARELWDGGPVVVARGRSCLALGHPAGAALVRTVLAACDAAVPRVTAVWGGGWAQRVVVLVPDSVAELARVVPDAGDLSQIAAVATAELVRPDEGYHPVGDRVLVNPVAFRQLGPVGRRVVMAHEVTHVASRAATGPQVPTWFVEGLADYVGYDGVRLPLAVTAAELRRDVRAGRLPAALPPDDAFAGGRRDLAQTYEQSWLAVVLLARTHGRPALLAVYRRAGADPRPGALDRALRAVTGTSLAAFTRAWRADLRRELS